MALDPSIAVFDLILGYDIACLWQGSTLNSIIPLSHFVTAPLH